MTDHPPLLVAYGDVVAARNAVSYLINCLEDKHTPLPDCRQQMVMRTLASAVAVAVAVDEATWQFDTLDEATDCARELRTRLGSYLPWPGPGGTQHAQPPTARSTATVQELDGRPLDRDEYAASLSEHVAAESHQSTHTGT